MKLCTQERCCFCEILFRGRGEVISGEVDEFVLCFYHDFGLVSTPFGSDCLSRQPQLFAVGVVGLDVFCQLNDFLLDKESC